MKLVSHLPAVGPALYIAPLINTVLLLLVFFYLGSSFVVQPGVTVSLPRQGSRLAGFERARVITIAAMPDAMIYLDGKRLSEEQLRQSLSVTEPGGARRNVIIHADERAPFGRVTAISELVMSLGHEVAYATAEVAAP